MLLLVPYLQQFFTSRSQPVVIPMVLLPPIFLPVILLVEALRGSTLIPTTITWPYCLLTWLTCLLRKYLY